MADSLSLIAKEKKQKQKENFQTFFPVYLNDSLWKIKTNEQKPRFNNIEEMLANGSIGYSAYSNIANKTSNLKSQCDLMRYDDKEYDKEVRLYRIEQHRKFALSFACIVFFLIGAPLGVITRKGGLGMPLVISVLFFIVFHILNTSGEKMVKEGIVSAASGMWMSTAFLIPIGIFLMLKARKDAQPFNTDKYYKLWLSIRQFIFRNKTINNPSAD